MWYPRKNVSCVAVVISRIGLVGSSDRIAGVKPKSGYSMFRGRRASGHVPELVNLPNSLVESPEASRMPFTLTNGRARLMKLYRSPLSRTSLRDDSRSHGKQAQDSQVGVHMYIFICLFRKKLPHAEKISCQS